MTERGGGQIRVLQAGRAVAALAVVCFHGAAAAATTGGGLPSPLSIVLGYGYLGVDFFFVLSGFIIYYVTWDQRPTPEWAANYSQSRLTRIFVPYLPVGVGVAILYVAMPGLSASTREWGWLSTLTLLPTQVRPALVVAWTLQHELAFYAVFALGFAFRRPMLATAAWCLSSLIVDYGVVLARINVEFLFGVIAAWAFLNKRLPLAPLLGIASLAVYVALGAQLAVRPLFALGLAGLILPVVKRDQSIDTPAWLVFLGGASYAIYLVHDPMTSIVTRVTRGWITVLVMCIALGVVAGTAYHLLWERPALRFIRRLSSQGSFAPPA